MKKILLVSSLVLALGGCGDENSNVVEKSSSSKKTVENVVDSRFSEYMSLEKVCDLLSAEAIQKAFNTTAEIKIEQSRRSYGGRFTCHYSWPRADAKEREQQMLTQMMEQMKKGAKKIPMRQKALDHNFSLSLSEYKAGADVFVPRKMTEEQVNQRIKSAKESAAKRLTEKQKAIAGSAADDMIVSMIKKSNQNDKIEGVGDAAFWENIGQGALNVLEGTTKITVAPMIGDNKAEDIANAKKIVNLIMAN